MVDPLPGDQQIGERSFDADRNVKIERLLLSGLDHYFKARYQSAIDIWTRVLFLDRSHARARAYIERARAALCERLRESEELVHTGVEAFERGDVTEARSLLTSAVEQGGGRDDALTVLDRLNRLEDAAGDIRIPRRSDAEPLPGRRELDADEHQVTRRVRIVPLVLFLGVVLAAGYLALSWGEWESLLVGRQAPRMVAPTVAEPLPLPSATSVRVSRARRLVEEGRLHQALVLLDSVGPGDPLVSEVDSLRAAIQRALLAPSTTPESDPGRSAVLPR